jgi:2-keto-4-pentenoate hydratase
VTSGAGNIDPVAYDTGFQYAQKKAEGAARVASSRDEAVNISERFLSARRAAGGFADYPGIFPDSLEEAYQIQDEAIAGWGRPVVGWKVGRVLPPHSDRFGTDRLAGPIFSMIEAHDGESPVLPVFAKGFAAGEAEFLLRIGSSLPPGMVSFSLDEAAELIDAVHVGIEIASSPLRTINELGPIAVVSDFGNNNGLLVGPAIPDWRTSNFEDWAVVTLIDGVEAGRGSASAFPDGAIGSARFLFEHLAQRGIAVRAGQWISSGAVTGVHDSRPGQKVEARFGNAYHLSCIISEERPEGGE